MWQGDIRYECKNRIFYRSIEWVEDYLQHKYVEATLHPKEEEEPVIMDGKKECYKCLERKLPTEFHRNANKKDGIASLCTTCARKKNVLLYNTEVSGRRAMSGYKTRLTKGAKYDPRCESARNDS